MIENRQIGSSTFDYQLLNRSLEHKHVYFGRLSISAKCFLPDPDPLGLHFAFVPQRGSAADRSFAILDSVLLVSWLEILCS